jgi:hypothetical protein
LRASTDDARHQAMKDFVEDLKTLARQVNIEGMSDEE